MKTNLTLSLILLIVLTGCVHQVTKLEQDDWTQLPEDFEFETIREHDLSVTIRTENQDPMKGILVKFWTQHPEEGGVVFLKGLTDSQGHFQTTYNLTTSMQSAVLEIGHIGLPHFLEITKDDLIEGIVLNGMTHKYLVLDSQVQEENAVTHENGRLEMNYVALGTYGSNGVPDYLEEDRDIITAELLSFIDASLPEGKPVPAFHPRYLDENSQTNIQIEALADVWMTFVHEGAGYRNILGFYTYETGNPPSTPDELNTIHIAFPNASFNGSGGGLTTGDKVHLGQFEAGTTIGFVLLANGWNGSITPGLHQVYSNWELNPESTPENQKHTVLLWDESNEIFLVGFEDLNRDGSSDDDFNDAIFYITSNPVEAISTTNVNPIDQPVDSDGDGVNDTYDEFPTDPSLAYSYQYPGENSYGTFAFEDQWPRLGDYDFNDLVVDYNYDQLANASNKLVRLRSEFILRAVGAGYTNGFGLILDASPSQILSVSGTDIQGELYSFNSNGTESGQSQAVIIVSDNVHQGFSRNGFINTSSELGLEDPDTIQVETLFTTPIGLNEVGIAPFNPFLVANQQRGREIHLPSYSPSDLADPTLFGSEDDTSDLLNGIYYKTSQGLPWGMNLPASFHYPLEKTDIRNGYHHFNRWSQSGGYSYMDWYDDKPGYRDHSLLFNQ